MLDHSSKLDIYSAPAALHSTGIICTIGPKTKEVGMLTELRKAGMNVVRMNFSHGSYEYHGSVVKAARDSVAESPLDGRLVGIALDTKGPEIRTGALKEELGSTVALEKGATLTVTTDAAFKDACDASTVLPFSEGDETCFDVSIVSTKIGAHVKLAHLCQALDNTCPT